MTLLLLGGVLVWLWGLSRAHNRLCKHVQEQNLLVLALIESLNEQDGMLMDMIDMAQRPTEYEMSLN